MNAVLLLNGFLLNLYRKKKEFGLRSIPPLVPPPLAVPHPQLPNYQSSEMPETTPAPTPKAGKEH